MFYKIDIGAQRSKSFKSFNCVSSIYVLETYMLMHKIFEFDNSINVRGIAVINHGGVSQMNKRWNSYICGKPGGVSQELSVSDINCRNKKYTEMQHQPGNIHDAFISLSTIVDLDEDDLDIDDVYVDLMTSRVAGGDITDVRFTCLGDENMKLKDVVKQGWVVIDRKDLVKKYGRYDTLVGINTGAIQKQHAVIKDDKSVSPHFAVTNLGYHVVGVNEDGSSNIHETVLGAVELTNVHKTDKTIEDVLWKWTNFSNFYVLTQEVN